MEVNPVRRLREALGLSQEKFARELGVSTASVRAYEGGQRLSEGALEKLKTLAAKNMLPDIAFDLDERPFQARKVFEGRQKVRLTKNPAAAEMQDALHATLDEILASGNPEALAAVEAVFQLSKAAIEASASKKSKHSAK